MHSGSLPRPRTYPGLSGPQGSSIASTLGRVKDHTWGRRVPVSRWVVCSLYEAQLGILTSISPAPLPPSPVYKLDSMTRRPRCFYHSLMRRCGYDMSPYVKQIYRWARGQKLGDPSDSKSHGSLALRLILFSWCPSVSRGPPSFIERLRGARGRPWTQMGQPFPLLQAGETWGPPATVGQSWEAERRGGARYFGSRGSAPPHAEQ